MKPRSSSRSCSESSASPLHSPRGAGARSPSVARARWSALLTEATLVSSASAVSWAENSSTSRRISTARWRAGRIWISARKPSSIVSRATTTASGSSARGATSSSSRSGIGLQPRDLGERARPPRRGGPCGGSRRGRRWWRSGTARRGSPPPPLEVVAVAPGAQERLLHEVLGLLEGAEHAVAVDVQLALVAVDVLGELVLGDGGHASFNDGRGRGLIGRRASGAGARSPRRPPARAGCRRARTATSARRPWRARRARPR